MHHRHGNPLHLVSASVPIAVVHVTSSCWQRAVLFTRAACCRHSNLLSEIRYSRIDITGSVLVVIPLKCRIIYRVILNCFFFYELPRIYLLLLAHSVFFLWAFFAPQVWYSTGMCAKFTENFPPCPLSKLRTLTLCSVWSIAEYITALCTETFTIFDRKLPGKVITHLEHNRRNPLFNHNGFMWREEGAAT
jgi:hypothetical protein